MKFFSYAAVAVLMLSSPAFAQEAVNADDFLKSQTAPAKVEVPASVSKDAAKTELDLSLDLAKSELKDAGMLKKKTALAKKMHEIRPTRDQVDAAVSRASMALIPQDRESFVGAMRSMLNYNAIERISMDAMVETYTLAELEAMVDYFSKPEALSASAKTGNWASKIQPEIVRMIDKAMMKIRTGQ